MFGIEKEVYEQLLFLKENFHLEAVKAEFEAEGSSFNDLVRLRRLTARAGVKLFLKIGGVEALRDIKDSLELGVDGIVAPMVESSFGLKKFMDAFKSIYKDDRIRLSINIETKNAVGQLEEIIMLGKGTIDNITLGRTDLSASFMDKAITPDTKFVMDLIGYVGKRAKIEGYSFTVGGSISAVSVEKFGENPSVTNNIDCIETRKVVLPRDVILKNCDALNEALRFEELYILSKKEFSDTFIGPELSRLTKLSDRANVMQSEVKNLA
jgi:hypothetical protein